MNKYTETYKEETRELLSELETALLELEEAPTDKELIGRVFRAMHTIKGSGAMFGFDDVVAFTHEIETVFDGVREGKIAVDKTLIDLTLRARDHIQKMLDGETSDKCDSSRLSESFRSMLVNKDSPIVDTLSENVPEENCDDKDKTESNDQHAEVLYRIRFRPDMTIFAKGTNPLLLLNELKELGECVVVGRTDAVPELKCMDPEGSYIYWDIVLGTEKGLNAIKDVFIFIEDDCELKIDMIDCQDGLDGAVYKRLGEILVEKGDVALEDLQRALANQKRIGEILIETGAANRYAIESALVEQQQVKKSLKRKQEPPESSSIRVAADKLDILVGLVGELVTVQASLSQKASINNDLQLTAVAEQVERLTGELRDNAMSIRMLPIGTSFSKFKRLVRDLSDELGKEVLMVTEGGETELDKTVIERLNDPLIHIIRNCIDHGIEAPHVREALGKHRKGTVSISALHSGAHVLIKISDDGKGLDPDTIRKKAIEKNLIDADETLSETEIFSQIFTPGFSTADQLTDVSGRGVGMDVVKRSIEALRGSVEVESKKGSGTTITLKLPLTLAIIDGLLVELGEEHYVMPLSAIEECIELKREDEKINGRHIVNVRGQMIPYVPLRELFRISEEQPEIEQIAIVEMEHGRIGFVIDHVIGEHQTVIKSLGKVYSNAKEFSGATLLADGSVALILDMHGVLQVAEEENGRALA